MTIINVGWGCLKWLAKYIAQKALKAIGFGSLGIIAKTAASLWQSYMYGAFVPAAGLFAAWQARGMVGF